MVVTYVPSKYGYTHPIMYSNKRGVTKVLHKKRETDFLCLSLYHYTLKIYNLFLFRAPGEGIFYVSNTFAGIT